MTGGLFAVVGPSGAGKDTLMAAAQAARPDIALVRRVITRPEAAGGEAFEGVSEAEFARRLAAGQFALHWRAHGLRYAIPEAELAALPAGPTLFNGSRAALPVAAARFPDLTVIRVTAPSAVLIERLLARGRETREEIEARVQRASYDLPAGLRVIDVRNDGPLAQGVARFLAALQPVSA
jgi:phosphonate metabolism protein PhnN/1,5-bisphosphokinase (PRPP-forming)